MAMMRGILSFCRHWLRAIVATKSGKSQHAPDLKKLGAALDNYNAVMPILRADLEMLLALDTDNPWSKDFAWRLNFIRASAALIEGHIHCIADMLKAAKPSFEERRDPAAARIKRTLKEAYRAFGLTPEPNFGGVEWPKAKKIFKKREALMHPKKPDDLNR